MSTTEIEWTDTVWNPTTGCDRVSDGCDHCYALTMAARLKGMEAGRIAKGTLELADAKYQTDGDPRTSGPGFGPAMHPDTLDLPLSWKKPRKVFVNSMSDLFHPKFTDEFIARVFAVMAATPRHTYQILTKRAPRMRSLLTQFLTDRLVNAVSWDMGLGFVVDEQWPLKNVWLGVSTENQEQADRRIPPLLDTPAAVRWISAEPLLGPIDLHNIDGIDSFQLDWMGGPGGGTGCPHPLLDWVVLGGESGTGARPMQPSWARSIRDQCETAEVPFLFKQWGAWSPTGAVGIGKPKPNRLFVGPAIDDHGCGEEIVRNNKKVTGRELDGRTWDQYPGVA